MICRKCGNNIDDNAIYCGFCGSKVEKNYTDYTVSPQNNNGYAVPPQPIVYTTNYVAPPTNTGTGIAALVLGLIGIFTWMIWIPSLLAVIFGIVGIASRDEQHTCGCAVAGLVLGLVTIIPSILVLLAIF